MRGFGSNASDNSLILINGVPLNNPDLQAPNLNFIPVQAIKKIDIIPASEGVLYGDQAVGGVINIITDTADTPQLQLEGEIGSFDQKNIFGLISNNLSNGFGYLISARKNHTYNYRDNNKDDQNNLYGQLKYGYKTGNVILEYFLQDQNLQQPGALTAEQVFINRRQAQNNQNFTDQQNHLIHLQQNQMFNDNWYLKTNFSYRNMNGNDFIFLPFTQGRNVIVFEPQLNGKLGFVSTIFGIQTTFDNYRLNGTPFQSTDKQSTQNLYGLLKIPLTEKIFFYGGARNAWLQNRLEQTQKYITVHDSTWVNSFGINYQISPQLSFYIRRDENYRFPKADENALVPKDVERLKVQTGASYESGIQINQLKWHAAFSLYRLVINNEIAFDPTQLPQQPLGANRNLPKTQRDGILLSGTYYLTDFWKVSFNYSFVDPTFVNGLFSGNEIPFVAKNVLRIGSNFRFDNGFSVYTEGIYTGSRFAANDFQNIAPKVPAFMIFNINMRYQYHCFYAAFRINNVFNKIYNSYTSFEPSSLSEFFYPSPERNFLLTIGYNFS